MDCWLLVLLGVGVWRLSRILWTERGPLDIFVRARALLAKRQKRSGGLYDLVSCFYCVSVWVAGLFAILISTSILTFIIYTLIMSGVAVIIQELVYKHK